ncbi:MAG: PLD nuclease N-terminal domain-containing protein [Candidatus Roizmanbacteria bacterium]
MKLSIYLFTTVSLIVLLSSSVRAIYAQDFHSKTTVVAQATSQTVQVNSTSEATSQSGNCTVNGKQVDCGQFWKQFGPIFAGIWIGVAIISIVAAGFWVWMLIDCIRRDFNDKLLWVVVLLFGQGLGAILYYFMVKKKAQKVPPAPAQPMTIVP